MDAETRKRAMDRIQKCLKLSKSANEHEAAAALRQAQKLMDTHGLSEADLRAAGYGKARVDTSIQASKNAPTHLQYLVSLIRKAFGVKPVFIRTLRQTDYGFSVDYFGPEHRLPMAVYAHTVLMKAVENAWKQVQIEKPEWKGIRGGRASFMAGWLSGVSEKIEAIAFSPEEETGINLILEAAYPTLGKSKVTQKLYGSVMAAGVAASAGFSLHRPVNGTERKALS